MNVVSGEVYVIIAFSSLRKRDYFLTDFIQVVSNCLV